MRSALLLSLALVLAGCQDPADGIEAMPKLDWTPPKSSLPADFVNAVKTVQAHGFGHPKPIRYVSAEVIIGSVWSPATKEKINGWLVEGNQVLAWNGVTYELVKELGPANLRKDVEAESTPLPGIRMLPHLGESIRSASGVAVLLIVGEVQLAEKLYTKLPTIERPVHALAYDFVFAKWDKVATAHMRGSSKEVIREARALLKLKEPLAQAMEKEAPGRLHQGTYFDYLAPLEKVIADNERRLREKKGPVDLAAIAKLPEAERIPKLIEALDQVDSTQDGQPGGVSLGTHPITAELVKIGAAAMPAIFDCMEKDTRLTRSLSFPRDFKTTRNYLPVSSAAVAAYQLISEDFDTISATPAELRARWAKNKGLSPAERQFAILQEEREGREWISAANYMVEPTNLTRTSDHSWSGVTPKPGDPQPTMKGEPLRTRTNPSVTDLLVKRIKSLITAYREEGRGKFDLEYALQMVTVLKKWDRASSLEAAQIVSRTVMNEADGRSIDQWPHFATAIRLRAELGDETALSEYATWVIEHPLETYYQGNAPAFEPLIRFNANPKIRAAGKAFANNLRASLDKAKGTNQIEGILNTPLIEVPEVQRLVLEVLSDHAKVADLWIEKDTVWISHSHGKSGQGLDRTTAKNVPKEGVKIDHRRCDALAMTLLRGNRVIEFEPYWPVAKRDAAIKSLRDGLKSGAFKVAKWDGFAMRAWE